MWLLTSVCILALQGLSVYSYASGALGKSCLEMVPHHKADPQAGEPPYILSVNQTTYSPGDILRVTLKQSPTTKAQFKGFIIGARRQSGDVEEVIGEFLVKENDIKIKPLSWYSDPPDVPNCVTHFTNAEKSEIEVDWKAPVESVGNIIFSATVVESFKVIYYNITAGNIKATKESKEKPFVSAVHVGSTGVRPGEGCGSKKGCVFYPSQCRGDDCKTVVSFSRDKDTIDFEIMSKTPGFVSLGFSTDKKMGSDQTITCTTAANNGGIGVQNGENPGYFNNRHRIVGITNISISRVADFIYCKFKRPLSMKIYSDGNTDSNATIYDLSEPKYLFMAHGSLYTGTDGFKKHIELPVITDSKVDFLSLNTYTVSALPVMVRLHGIFMVFAWVALAGLGLLTAEFYKDRFDFMICKVKLWFHLHRTIMISVYTFSAVGIILIFVNLKKWSENATVHGAFGIATMSFATLQVLAGMCRPDLKSPARKYFNIFHRCGGYVTQILSVTSIFLVTTISIVPKELRDVVFYTAIAWVVLDVLWNLLHILVSQKMSLTPSNADDLTVTHKDGQVELSTNSQSQEISVAQSREIYRRRLIYSWMYAIFAVMLAILTVTLMYFIITC